MNESANYIDTYRDGGIYSDPEYGSPYISKGVKFARFMGHLLPANKKVLCLGCGNGFEIVEYLNQGHDAYGTEVHPIEGVEILSGRIVNAIVPDLPFRNKEFFLLHCTEVLEHIPSELTDDFLKECRRVSQVQFFSIATEMDSYRTHINVHGPEWWIEAFNRNGMNLVNFQFKPMVSNLYCGKHHNIYYGDGVTVLCGQLL